MEVKVVNPLSAFMIAIVHYAKSFLGNTLFTGDFGGDMKHMTDQVLVFFPYVEECGDVFFRYQDGVNRRMWVDVLKGKGKVVLIYDIRGDSFLDDLAKNAGAHLLPPCLFFLFVH
jgi:hypothetical protein